MLMFFTNLNIYKYLQHFLAQLLTLHVHVLWYKLQPIRIEHFLM